MIYILLSFFVLILYLSIPALRSFASRAAEKNRQGYISPYGHDKMGRRTYIFIGDN
jgi:hypothetical protein